MNGNTCISTCLKSSSGLYSVCSMGLSPGRLCIRMSPVVVQVHTQGRPSQAKNALSTMRPPEILGSTLDITWLPGKPIHYMI